MDPTIPSFKGSSQCIMPIVPSQGVIHTRASMALPFQDLEMIILNKVIWLCFQIAYVLVSLNYLEILLPSHFR